MHQHFPMLLTPMVLVLCECAGAVLGMHHVGGIAMLLVALGVACMWGGRVRQPVALHLRAGALMVELC